MSTGRPHHYCHLLQVKKESLPLYTSFHNLINVYSRMSGADNPRGQNFDVNTKPLVTLVIMLQFPKKISLKSDFIKLFFTILYISLYPFVASFKEISLNSNFIQLFS